MTSVELGFGAKPRQRRLLALQYDVVDLDVDTNSNLSFHRPCFLPFHPSIFFNRFGPSTRPNSCRAIVADQETLPEVSSFAPCSTVVPLTSIWSSSTTLPYDPRCFDPLRFSSFTIVQDLILGRLYRTSASAKMSSPWFWHHSTLHQFPGRPGLRRLSHLMT